MLTPVTQDPATLAVIWSRLISIAEECWVTVWRTAFSLIIGEAQDFGVELLDAQGNSLAHAPRSMPVFNLTLPMAVRALLQRFPPESLAEGDVLITNDPWICAGHLFDIALVTPVFRAGRLVALVGSIAHCSDIGGTRDALAAREIYEEGLQIPPLRLRRAGATNGDLLDLIAANVRKPELVLGDIQAQLSANEVGARRLLDLMDEYGIADLAPLAAQIQGRSEQAMRQAIAAVPDGTYRAETRFDSAGMTIGLPVAVTIHGDSLTVDWAGAPPQVARGGVNCTLSYTMAHSAYALKCLLSPEVPSNAGCYRPLAVSAPAGSILNCARPAAVSVRTMVGWYCAPALFQALAPVLPERAQAYTAIPTAVGAYGRERDGVWYNDHLFQGGGQGGSAHGDGKSALLYPTSAANTSVELFERRAPLLVEAKELIPDSGGPGAQRGGLGQRLRLRKLHDDGLPAQLGLSPQGLRFSMPGLAGGLPGRRAAISIAPGPDPGEVGAPPPDRDDTPPSLIELTTTRESVTIDLGGGSGYGPPDERPLAAVQADLDAGYITTEGLAAYGCAVDSEGRVCSARH